MNRRRATTAAGITIPWDLADFRFRRSVNRWHFEREIAPAPEVSWVDFPWRRIQLRAGTFGSLASRAAKVAHRRPRDRFLARSKGSERSRRSERGR